MAEPLQSRVDFSRIHPLKRLTLIVLGFLFGTSIVLAICMQFFFVIGAFGAPHFLLGGGGNQFGLRLSIMAAQPFIWTGDFECALYSADENGLRLSKLPADSCLAPGLYFDTGDELVCGIGIHHAWLISITAALYIFARWRIRRSAIKTSHPEQPLSSATQDTITTR